MADLKPRVDQSKATAGGDNVAGDKTNIDILNHSVTSAKASTVERLMDRLAAEMRDDVITREQIDTLQHYHTRKSHDGVDGLEEKLKASGRHDQVVDAFEKKELFVKLLNRFSLYASAQEVFAFILARADRKFRSSVLPMLGELDNASIDLLIENHIVEPIVEEVGPGVFTVNDAIVMGMVYWLAEQCFVRWHA